MRYFIDDDGILLNTINEDDKVKIVAEYRLKYEDISLQELSEIISSEIQSKITKSGVSHRLAKVKELAQKMKKIDK